MSKKAQVIRNQFQTETDTPVINSQGEYNIDYVHWLENKVEQYAEQENAELRERMKDAYCAAWRKSKKHQKRSNFLGLNRSQIEGYFNVWYDNYKNPKN